MKISKQKQVVAIMIVSVVLSVAVFIAERIGVGNEEQITRNAYGRGKKTEDFELTIEGESESESVQIEVEEQKYTHEEIQKMFEAIPEKLDEIILGENANFDRIEKNLNLVTELSGYPVQIQWELSSYDILNPEGEIIEENVSDDGSLVELRGTITCEDEKMIYIRSVMVYPITRVGTEKLLHDIRQEILRLQEETREDMSFSLPKEVNGRKLEWSKKVESRWYYILILGIVFSIFLIYREREQLKQKEQKRKEELLQDYPGMISKFTMLLSAGATVRNAWEKIVQNYEKQKKQLGEHIVYEEMRITLHEMQGGVSEAEAYERFGKRCGNTVYLKFGAMLSQNLRKGSRGISEILRVEAIQSFENRKSIARRRGEEVGTKLLMPMFGMLAVVFVMIMVPAFMSMQL